MFLEAGLQHLQGVLDPAEVPVLFGELQEHPRRGIALPARTQLGEAIREAVGHAGCIIAGKGRAEGPFPQWRPVVTPRRAAWARGGPAWGGPTRGAPGGCLGRA